MFKLARIDGAASRIGKPGSYQVSDTMDVDAAWTRLEPAAPDEVGIVALRTGRAHDLRRRAVPDETPVPSGFEAFALSYSRAGDFVAEVCAHGPDVIVLAPAALRQAVIEHLTAVAEGVHR
jgi:proteasome accessory factor B